MRFPQAMDQQVQVRVTADEKRQLRQVATKRGMTLSDLLRESAKASALQNPNTNDRCM